MKSLMAMIRSKVLSTKWVVVLVFFTALAQGCAGNAEPVCSAEAVASVQVKVKAPDGEVTTAAQVAYTVDGGASKMCEPSGSMEFVCGYEEAGDFVITATPDSGGPMGSAEVKVASDECHVQTQKVEIQLGEPGS